jgi:P-type E1-E2 ATPase
MQTELGKIGKSLSQLSTIISPLQADIKVLINRFAIFGVTLSAIVFLIYGLTYKDWLQGALAGISLTMSLLPQEFTVILTVFMALGVWRISQQHVLTRRSSVIETLGSINTLCVDKTGTLTLNKMTLVSLATVNRVIDISSPLFLPSKLEQEFEREPSHEELAAITDLPIEKISDALRISGRHVSMDAPFANGEESTLLDVLENSESPSADLQLMSDSLKQEVERSLSTLNEREREVVILFFGIGLTHGLSLEEIGAKFDLTRERVRQIKEKAIRRLRTKNRSKLLKPYLGEE